MCYTRCKIEGGVGTLQESVDTNFLKPNGQSRNLNIYVYKSFYLYNPTHQQDKLTAKDRWIRHNCALTVCNHRYKEKMFRLWAKPANYHMWGICATYHSFWPILISQNYLYLWNLGSFSSRHITLKKIPVGKSGERKWSLMLEKEIVISSWLNW